MYSKNVEKLKVMIHNHEVSGSIPDLATRKNTFTGASRFFYGVGRQLSLLKLTEGTIKKQNERSELQM